MAISYRSYCWVMGTTSFRTAQLNRKIEEQISILNEFRKIPECQTAKWNNDLQGKYYKYMKAKGFIKGKAARPDKDAREKTSGLVELGFINENRVITPVGKRLLEIASSGDFSPDKSNLLEISRDSYLYLQQLLKAAKLVGSEPVRPFVVFLYLMTKLNREDGKRFLTDEEFAYLLPLCVNKETTDMVAQKINDARSHHSPVDMSTVILSILLGMDNYKEALDVFISAGNVTEQLLCKIGMNRKSGSTGISRYDAKYKPVYDALHKVMFKGKSEANLKSFLSSVNCLSGNIAKLWRSFFFAVGSGRQVTAPLCAKFRNITWNESETSFRANFFKVMHLLKAKATLGDYSDLNRRYFSLSDCVVFQEGKVFLDALPSALTDAIAEWTEVAAFMQEGDLENDVSLETIIGRTLPAKEALITTATGMNASAVNAEGGVDAVLKSIRYKNFATVLDSQLTKEKVSELLGLIEDRANDTRVQQMVTDDADIPTIFEYLVAIAWYYISDRQGDVLEYMNLSLGANFLPKTHAGGGTADIVWRYPACVPSYPQHTLLIEVTVSEKDSQRRMEMEPVSRHLGDYLLAHEDESGTYCTFVATHLNPNVISDFRGKRHQTYYDSKDTSRYVHGMKIIPIDTEVIRGLLSRNVHYVDLHAIFDENYGKDTEPWEWYKDLCNEMSGLP